MPVAVRSEAPTLRLPTQDDLPYSDGEPMENDFHVFQMMLIIEILSRWFEDRDCFAGGNMFLHYRLQDALSGARNRFRGPDVLVATGVPNRRQKKRKSWVVWEEGKAPDVVIEIVSRTTAAEDRGEKKRVYQDEVKVPEYFLYDPEAVEVSGFRLVDGRYQPILPDAAGRLPSHALGLLAGVWEGEYRGSPDRWMRWMTPEGELLLTDAEVARSAELGERSERERAARLAGQLRALGVDPDSM